MYACVSHQFCVRLDTCHHRTLYDVPLEQSKTGMLTCSGLRCSLEISQSHICAVFRTCIIPSPQTTPPHPTPHRSCHCMCGGGGCAHMQYCTNGPILHSSFHFHVICVYRWLTISMWSWTCTCPRTRPRSNSLLSCSQARPSPSPWQPYCTRSLSQSFLMDLGVSSVCGVVYGMTCVSSCTV